MTQAAVSVIVPTYNRAGLLPAALDSVLAQSLPQPLEIVVIDDGSTDDTPQVVKRYLDRDLNGHNKASIRYTRLEKKGVVTARNTGIAQTHAPFVAFLDSDDLWTPHKLASQLETIHADPGIGLVHTSFRYVDPQGRFCDDGPQRLDNPCVGQCVDALLNEDLVIFSSVLVRRSIIEQAAASERHGLPFDPRWTNAQDYDLLLRVARLTRYGYIAEPLTRYRLHGGHGAMGNLRRAFGYHCRVQMDFVDRYGAELGIDRTEAKRRAAQFILGRATAAFWRRQMDTAKDLCGLAQELGLYDQAFAQLERKSSRWIWLYRVKDTLDGLLGKG